MYNNTHEGLTNAWNNIVSQPRSPWTVGVRVTHCMLASYQVPLSFSLQFPTPCTYMAPRVLGKNCPVKQNAPAYTMSARQLKSLARPGKQERILHKSARNLMHGCKFFAQELCDVEFSCHCGLQVQRRSQPPTLTTVLVQQKWPSGIFLLLA